MSDDFISTPEPTGFEPELGGGFSRRARKKWF